MRISESGHEDGAAVAEYRTCPICKRSACQTVTAGRYRPFCSKRCADVDLSRWLNGVYAIPATASDEGNIPEEEKGIDLPSDP